MAALFPDVVWNEANTTENLTLWEYLERMRGPQQLSLEIAVPLTIVNVVIFVTGLVGNIIVCAVIVKHPSLHTATNYYLFNLAISDLTLLIFGLPNDVSVYWHQYPWVLGEGFCKIRTLLSEMASYVSVLTIVAFSTERYLAICHPLYVHTMSGLQRAIRIIGCLWLIALFSATPFCLYTSVDYLIAPDGSNSTIKESAFCAMFSVPESFPLAELSTILFFIVPMLIIAVQYTKMGLKISKLTGRRLGNGLKGSVHRGSRRSHSHRGVIRMLAAVVVGFFICWAPFHAQRLLYIYGRDYQEINAWVFFVTGILYYLSSTLNPVFYNLMSKKYRNAFKEVLFGIKHKHAPLTRNSTLRDTHSRYSHTENIRTATNDSSSRYSRSQLRSNLLIGKDDELQLVEQEILTASTPKMNSSFPFILHHTSKRHYKETIRISNENHNETCI